MRTSIYAHNLPVDDRPHQPWRLLRHVGAGIQERGIGSAIVAMNLGWTGSVDFDRTRNMVVVRRFQARCIPDNPRSGQEAATCTDVFDIDDTNGVVNMLLMASERLRELDVDQNRFGGLNFHRLDKASASPLMVTTFGPCEEDPSGPELACQPKEEKCSVNSDTVPPLSVSTTTYMFPAWDDNQTLEPSELLERVAQWLEEQDFSMADIVSLSFVDNSYEDPECRPSLLLTVRSVPTGPTPRRQA